MASSPSRFLPRLLLFFFFSFTVVTASSSITHETTTHLRFYLHEIISGPNRTTAVVAGPPGANASSFAAFGQVAVVDDMLREGPDPGSRLLGRAQGLAAQTTLQGSAVATPALLTLLEFVFTEGEFNGSTLEILGRFGSGSKPVERGIVGGSGRFRMARGYTLTTVVTPAPAPAYFLMQIDAYIVHH